MEQFTFFSIFIIGLSYGATACMFSCMPFLSPLLISNSNSIRQSLRIILPFSIGRIISYIILAIFAYMSSTLVKEALNDNRIFTMILGTSTTSMGLFLFYQSLKSNTNCKPTVPFIKKSNVSKIGIFLIGITISINPCAPIMMLLAVSVNSTNIANAIGLGLSFGLGAIFFSIVFYGFIVSKVIKGLMVQFSSYKVWVERFAALLLIIVGALVLNGSLVL